MGTTGGAAYAIAASGLVLTYSTTRVFNIAHGALGMLLSFVFWDFSVRQGMPLWLALFLVLAMTATTFLTQRQLMAKNMPADALSGPYAQQQKLLLYVLPVAFGLGGVAFPIGVLLYWTTSNLWTMGQQFYVIRNNPAPGTPAFKAEQNIETIDDLLRAPLIHLHNEETDWTTWTDWFRALGRPAPKGRSFKLNNYTIALQAAQDDVGAMLGWDELVGPLLEDGRLIKLVPDEIPSPMGFYLRVHPRASEKARIFVDWLIDAT